MSPRKTIYRPSIDRGEDAVENAATCHHRSSRPFTLIRLLFITLLFTATADLCATPQFAVRYKQTCQLCHHNPTGGGMRSLYGAQYVSYKDLPMKPAKDFAELENYQPQLNRNVQVGMDFRTLYYSYRNEEDSQADRNSFLTMQGDVYLAFLPTEKVVIYIEKGLTSHWEAFGQLQGLPLTGVVKFGRFVPNYGWRFADHKSFVRDALGFSQYPTKGSSIIEDSGVEIGIYPMYGEFTLALTNGSASTAPDSDEGKAVTARGALRHTLLGCDMTAGASYRYSQIGLPSPDYRYAGGFWGISYAPVVYLGEADWMMRGGTTALASTHTVTFKVKQGWGVSGTYDFYDPDIDLKSGHHWRARVSTELYPTGYLELIPAFEVNEEMGRRYNSAELQVHLWF